MITISLLCFIYLLNSVTGRARSTAEIDSFVDLPTDKNEALIVQKTLAFLKKTELQLVTWRREVALLKYLFYSIEMFAPFFKNLVIIYEEEDHEKLKSSIPLNSFPIPVTTRIIKKDSKLRLIERGPDSEVWKSCKNPRIPSDHYNLRLGYNQQQYYNFFADYFSAEYENIDHIALIDSDMIFSSFEYLAGTVIDQHGNLAYNIYNYSSVDPENKVGYRKLFKPTIDKLLKVDNGFEFMTKELFIFPKNAFLGFRKQVLQNNPEFPSFHSVIQSLYIDNRICLDHQTVEESILKHGILSNFNLLVAYQYYYNNKFSIFQSTSKGIVHLAQSKNSADPKQYPNDFANALGKNIGCAEWYCYKYNKRDYNNKNNYGSEKYNNNTVW